MPFRVSTQPAFSINSFALNAAAITMTAILCLLSVCPQVFAQKRRTFDGGGARAVVVDERLAVLRGAPDISAPLVQRLSRGRVVFISGVRRTPDGLLFYRVAVTRRTRGWLQSDSVVVPARAGEDARLARLINGSESFDRLARARIFLDVFPKSTVRPAILLLYGDAAEDAAAKLSRDAGKRLDEREVVAGGAPGFSYYLNFNELDRYQRNGINFVFDRTAKQFHYDGASWREILRRYPRSPEAEQARARLASLQSVSRR
ncbi:MAG: hypothetical protein ABR577_12900 [Pyrinomonadaceae bacterium]